MAIKEFLFIFIIYQSVLGKYVCTASKGKNESHHSNFAADVGKIIRTSLKIQEMEKQVDMMEEKLMNDIEQDLLARWRVKRPEDDEQDEKKEGEEEEVKDNILDLSLHKSTRQKRQNKNNCNGDRKKRKSNSDNTATNNFNKRIGKRLKYYINLRPKRESFKPKIFHLRSLGGANKSETRNDTRLHDYDPKAIKCYQNINNNNNTKSNSEHNNNETDKECKITKRDTNKDIIIAFQKLKEDNTKDAEPTDKTDFKTDPKTIIEHPSEPTVNKAAFNLENEINYTFPLDIFYNIIRYTNSTRNPNRTYHDENKSLTGNKLALFASKQSQIHDHVWSFKLLDTGANILNIIQSIFKHVI